MAAPIGAIAGSDPGTGAVFAVHDSGGSATGLYRFSDQNGDTAVDEDELNLMAVVDTAVTHTDIAIV